MSFDFDRYENEDEPELDFEELELFLEEEDLKGEEYSLTIEAIKDLRNGKLEKELSEEELLIVRFIDSMEMREMGSPTTEDIDKLLKWYSMIRIGQTLVDFVLRGEAHIHFLEEDTEGEDPVFSLTPLGKSLIKETRDDEG